jgi:putative ABC transport system ATP-binding protein
MNTVVTPAPGEPVVRCREVCRTYGQGELAVHALRDLTLDVVAGDFVSLAGPSGSGKSTLLNVIGALDAPTSGTVEVLGRDVGALSAGARARLRLGHLGFVFQAYNLLPVLSARENVEFILQLQGVPPAERRERALATLAALGLEGLSERRPAALSGGQQQRVAVARAVVSEPALLLADEPSANLDSRTTEELLELLSRLNAERGMTIVTATHDPRVMAHARRRIHLVDGAVAEDERADTAPAP